MTFILQIIGEILVLIILKLFLKLVSKHSVHDACFNHSTPKYAPHPLKPKASE